MNFPTLFFDIYYIYIQVVPAIVQVYNKIKISVQREQLGIYAILIYNVQLHLLQFQPKEIIFYKKKNDAKVQMSQMAAANELLSVTKEIF